MSFTRLGILATYAIVKRLRISLQHNERRCTFNENVSVHEAKYICSAPIENLVRFQNRTAMLRRSGNGYPVLEPAAPFENGNYFTVS